MKLTQKPIIEVRDFILVCKDCILFPDPIRLEEIINIEYRIWPEGNTVEDAEYYVIDEGEFGVIEEELQVPLPNELPTGKYQVQMRAYYGEGEPTEWTEAVSFELESISEEDLLTLYPNPYVEDINLLYQSFIQDEVTIELTDANTGKRLLQERMKVYEGKNEWQLTVPDSSSEIVILKLHSKNQNPIIKKLIRAR